MSTQHASDYILKEKNRNNCLLLLSQGIRWCKVRMDRGAALSPHAFSISYHKRPAKVRNSGGRSVEVKPDALDDVVVEAKLREPGESLQVVDFQHVLIRQTQSAGLCHDLCQ